MPKPCSFLNLSSIHHFHQLNLLHFLFFHTMVLIWTVEQHTKNEEQLNCKENKTALKSIDQQTVQTQLNKEGNQLGTPTRKIAAEDKRCHEVHASD